MPDLASGLQQVTAVAVLPEAETHRALRHMFAHANWILLAAGDRRSGLAILANEPVAAVISECRLPDGTWHDLLNDMAQFEVPLRLIVTSRTADERLWAEVLNLGGFDVLAQPFYIDEAIRVVELAWLNWKEAWQERLGQRTRHAGEA